MSWAKTVLFSGVYVTFFSWNFPFSFYVYQFFAFIQISPEYCLCWRTWHLCQYLYISGLYDPTFSISSNPEQSQLIRWTHRLQTITIKVFKNTTILNLTTAHERTRLTTTMRIMIDDTTGITMTTIKFTISSTRNSPNTMRIPLVLNNCLLQIIVEIQMESVFTIVWEKTMMIRIKIVALQKATRNLIISSIKTSLMISTIKYPKTKCMTVLLALIMYEDWLEKAFGSRLSNPTYFHHLQ